MFRCDIIAGHLLRVHHVKMVEDMVVHKCQHCDFVTNKHGELRTHMSCNHVHTRDVPCPHCGKLYKSDFHLTAHIRYLHTEKKFKCKRCSYTAAAGAKLLMHIQTVHEHGSSKPYKCPYCDFTCTASNNCRKHVQNKHKGCEVRYVKLQRLPPASVQLKAMREAEEGCEEQPSEHHDMTFP